MLWLKQALDLGRDRTRPRTRTGTREGKGQGGGQASRQAAGSWYGIHAHREMFCSSFQCNRASMAGILAADDGR